MPDANDHLSEHSIVHDDRFFLNSGLTHRCGACDWLANQPTKKDAYFLQSALTLEKGTPP